MNNIGEPCPGCDYCDCLEQHDRDRAALAKAREVLEALVECYENGDPELKRVWKAARVVLAAWRECAP